MNRKENSTSDVRSSEIRLSFCDVTCNRRNIRSQNISVRFEPGSRDTVYSSLIALLALERENRIRGGESTGFTPRLYTCTFTRNRHTRTRYSHPHSRSACTQNHWVHSLTSVSYARSPLRHRRKRAQKFTPTNTILPFLCTFVAKTRITEITGLGNRETPEKCVGGGVYRGACQVIALSQVLLYRLAQFYGIFDTLWRHACIPTCRKLILQK